MRWPPAPISFFLLSGGTSIVAGEERREEGGREGRREGGRREGGGREGGRKGGREDRVRVRDIKLPILGHNKSQD